MNENACLEKLCFLCDSPIFLCARSHSSLVRLLHHQKRRRCRCWSYALNHWNVRAFNIKWGFSAAKKLNEMEAGWAGEGGREKENRNLYWKIKAFCCTKNKLLNGLWLWQQAFWVNHISNSQYCDTKSMFTVPQPVPPPPLRALFARTIFQIN